MKNKRMKQTAIALIITLLTGTMISGQTVNVEAAGISLKAAANPVVLSDTEQEETVTGEPVPEESTTAELTTEETTTQEPVTEEPTTEEPTTQPDYEIINGVYKVKEGVLIEYLGKKTDSSVTAIVIPKAVTKIDDKVFAGYKYIKKVAFTSGSKLTEIGQYAFNNCTAMTSIVLPTGLKKIGYRAFNNCTALKSITIPSTVTEADRILGKSKSVTKVTFAAGMKTIPQKILMNAYSVTTVSMKSGVTTIGKKAFYNCTALSTVSLPATVTTIKTSAFRNCTKLKQLELGKIVKTIGTNAFSGDSSLTLLVYANSTAKAYARKNKIKWDYTASEKKRRATSQAIYTKYTSLISAKNKSKYQLKFLKNYVPQGVCVIGDYLVVSMYYKNLTKNSILVLYNKTTGAYVKKVVLPSKDHVSSVANVKGRLVIGLVNISTTDYVAVISKSKLKKIKSGKTIKYDYTTKITGHADFAAFDGTVFWAGHSADTSTAKMYGYTVKVKKKKLVFTPKYSYTVPANSQGLIVKKGKGSKRTFVFSQSYGRLNDSALVTYSVNIKKSNSLGTATSTKALPSMSEGMYMTSGGKVYIVFESAAGLYCSNPDNTSEIQIKNVGKIKYSKLSKLKAK